MFANNCALVDQWSEEKYICPSMIVSPAVGEWREESGRLFSLKTPVLGNFSSCGKKQLYQSCVKVLNLRSLAAVKESRWSTGAFSDILSLVSRFNKGTAGMGGSFKRDVLCPLVCFWAWI